MALWKVYGDDVQGDLSLINEDVLHDDPDLERIRSMYPFRPD